MKKENILIVGGGPVGLYLAGKLEEAKVNYLLIEAKELGGQIPSLYPEKPVVDVPLFPPMKAKDIIAHLLEKVDLKHVHVGELVNEIKDEDDKVIVSTSLETYEASKVVIATGLGFYKPRPLGVEHETEAKNILYALEKPELLKDKEVAIFGGGDSALDWAATLSSLAKVHLIHRRREFRGNAETIKDKMIDVLLPYVPHHIDLEGAIAKSVTIEHVETKELLTLNVDYILVNYGSMPEANSFGYARATVGFGYEVNDDFKLSKHVYTCGDAVKKDGYAKRMMPGFKQVDIILKELLS